MNDKPIARNDDAGSSEKILTKFLSDGDVADGNRSRSKANKILPALRQHLGLSNNGDLDEALESFAIEVILGAAWYTRKTDRAKWIVRIYIFLNSALVIIIPVAIQYIPSTVAQITGVLTGILSLQKTLSSWYANNLQYGAWYKAGSDLKSIYYGLANKWSGGAAANLGGLYADLTAATDRGRAIIEAEKLEYYQRLSLPSFDVLDMLTSNRSAVAGLVSGLKPTDPPKPIVTIGTKAILTAPPATTSDAPVGQDAEVAGDFRSELLAGDPDEPLEELRVSTDSSQATATLMSPFLLVSDNVIDPAQVFGRALAIAETEAAARISRSSNQARIQQYLDVFGLPFYQPPAKGMPPPGKPTKFCAAGVSWAVLRAYCDIAGIAYTDNDDTAVLRRAMPQVHAQLLTLSPMCQDILIGAQHRGLWRSPDVNPSPGWIVLYNWSKPADATDTTLYPAEHIGFVRGKVGSDLQTVEFNTTFEVQVGKQGDGGAVSNKDRILRSVLGYVATYPDPTTIA